MSTLSHPDAAPPASVGLRVIPIAKPGGAGFSFAVAPTDEVEETVRKNAAAQGLLAGAAIPIKPDPTIWKVIDYLKAKR
jgi:hypothetical protein